MYMSEKSVVRDRVPTGDRRKDTGEGRWEKEKGEGEKGGKEGRREERGKNQTEGGKERGPTHTHTSTSLSLPQRTELICFFLPPFLCLPLPLSQEEDGAKPKTLSSQKLSPKWCFLDCE